MKLCFTPSAWSDYLWFQEHDRKLLNRINQLIRDVLRSPHEGIGKPEALRGELAGYWSRRINDEHRLVYSASSTEVVVIACRYHYGQQGVAGYEIRAGFIRVQLADGAVYLYADESAGPESGRGLTAFISREVRLNYARRERRRAA